MEGPYGMRLLSILGRRRLLGPSSIYFVWAKTKVKQEKTGLTMKKMEKRDKKKDTRKKKRDKAEKTKAKKKKTEYRNKKNVKQDFSKR